MNNTDTKQDELREKLEDISCEYGRPHEDSCDLNQEEGAVDGCTCSVGKLLDEIAEFVDQYATTLAERKAKEARINPDAIYEPTGREYKYEAAIQVVSSLNGELGVDYSLTSISVKAIEKYKELTDVQ